jgi:hypothetical protein
MRMGIHPDFKMFCKMSSLEQNKLKRKSFICQTLDFIFGLFYSKNADNQPSRNGFHSAEEN